MNRDAAIAKIKRRQTDIKALRTAIEGDAFKFPKLIEALQKLDDNTEGLIQTLADSSFIVGPDLDITSQVEVVKKGVKRVRSSLRRIRKIADDVTCDIEESLGGICTKPSENSKTESSERQSLPAQEGIPGKQNPQGQQPK